MAKLSLFDRRRRRVRTSLRARSAGKPRLSVHRSGRHIYAQVIDDTAGARLASASTLDKDLKGKTAAPRGGAAAVGLLHFRANTTVVTARLTAHAWIVGAPDPITPPERTVYVTAEDRTVVVAAEDRTQMATAEQRSVPAFVG